MSYYFVSLIYVSYISIANVFMKTGYASVSTQDQNFDMQIDALTKAGCEIIFNEKISGKTKERPELLKQFEKLRKGDTVVMWKLDCLGRFLKDSIDLVTKIQQLEASLSSMLDGIDSSTVTGRFTFNIFASLAEFERENISERTKAGLTSTRFKKKRREASGL